MALTHYYVDPGGGNDTTGDGSIGTPWATVQKALDTITQNVTDGDQINVKAGTADTLSSALSFATYGNPRYDYPLIIRGYTSAADDGGVGELSGGGSVAIFTATAGVNATQFVDMKLGNCGSANVLTLADDCTVQRCEIYGSSGTGITHFAPSGLFRLSVLDCTLYDLGIGVNSRHSFLVSGCLFYDGATNSFSTAIRIGASSNPKGVVNTRIAVSGSGNGVEAEASYSQWTLIQNCSIWSDGGTGAGIVDQVTIICWMVRDNVVSGFSGVGGRGIVMSGADRFQWSVTGNRVYNCTTALTLGRIVLEDDNTTLGSDPFTDAANNDFSPTQDLIIDSTLNLMAGAVQNAYASGGGGGPLIGGRLVR